MIFINQLVFVCLVFIFGLTGLYAKSNSHTILSGFVENAGQIKNQDGLYHSSLFFSLQTAAVNVRLKTSSLSYEVTKNKTIQRVDIQFLGANLVQPVGEMVLPGNIIYRDKKDANKAVTAKQYQRVYYANLYSGIDLECLVSTHAANGLGFKYNFIIHPGADPNLIQMQVDGAKSWVDKKGNLCFKTITGLMQDELPLSFETNSEGEKLSEVKASFIELKRSIFGLKIGNYNTENTLIVDPILWATYYGGYNYDMAKKVITDSAGNVYLAGQTYSLNAIATTGAYQTSLAPNNDAFLAKFSANGTLLWATYYGGMGSEYSYGLALTKDQEIIIGGYTTSSSGIATNGAYQVVSGGGNDGFIAKFSPSGSLLWATYLGWEQQEIITGICLDELDGDINIIGTSTSITVGNFPGVYADSAIGQLDILIAKFSAQGSVKWISMYGGTLNDYSTAIQTNNSGNLYFVGYTYSNTEFATAGAWRSVNSSTINSDAFITVFDSSGQLIRSTFYGGTRQDVFSSLAIDSVGAIYVIGHTNSMDSISTPGSFQENYYGIITSYDMMLIKFNEQLRPIWATYIGGKGNDFLYDVTISRNGYIVCGGNTNSDSLATPNADLLNLSTLNYQAAYVTVFKGDGSRHFASYYTGNSSNYIYSIATNNLNDVYFTGVTTSVNNYFITSGAHQTVYNGASEAYLAKLQIPYPQNTILPITSNTIAVSAGSCSVALPSLINGSTPNGGNGSFTYLWLQSHTGASGLFYPASGINSNQNYQPSATYPQTWYKRMVYSGADSLVSNILLIDLNASVKADFSINKTIQCHRNNQFTFTDNSTSSETYSRYWDFDNGNFGLNPIDTQTFVYGVKNYFDVKLRIETTGGCIDSATKRVFLIGHPDTNTINGLTEVKQFDTASYSVPFTTGSIYHWRFNNAVGYSLGSSITVKWTKMGVDTLYLIEQNSGGCLSDTMRLAVNIKPSVGLLDLNHMEFQVYPNPANNLLYVEKNEPEKYTIHLTNAFGASVLVQTEVKGTSLIDTSLLPDGIYFLQVTNDLGEVAVTKIIIQH